MGLALAATGTHPWANYLDQRIIDTPHYARLREELRWVAQRNSTWSLHVHVGVRGADRAVAVCDHLRGVLPALLALSANSPFLDGRDTGLSSVRTEIFTRTFPRCGIHEPFGSWEAYRDFIELLVRTNSIVEATQLWWSVRPHHTFGTVEVRICDAQTGGEESFALAALMAACVAQSALDYDEGRLPEPLGQREIEENLWRAIRHGMDGKMIDFDRGEELPTLEAVERLLEWTAPARQALGLDLALPELNGARRARRALEAGASIEEIYGEALAETKRTYVPRPGGLDEVNDAEARGEGQEREAPERPRAAQPSQEELREQIEEQLRKVRVQDLLLESVVSVINLSARRIAKDDERDLEQGRVGIEAVRAVVGLLDDEPAQQVRSALSEVQVLYARHAGGGSGEPEGGGEAPPRGGEAPPGEGAQRGPSRLWTPPGSGPPR